MARNGGRRTGEIFAQIDELHQVLDGQVVVSQSRWVDHLLDLLNLVELPSLRRVVEGSLSSIRNLGSVESRWMSNELKMLASAIEIEAAFDAVAAPLG